LTAAAIKKSMIVTVIKIQMMISATHPDSHTKIDIAIRPVTIPDDIKWLQQWAGLDANCLIPFYQSIEASSFIQSMMAWDSEQPVLQFDICEAIFDDLGAGELVGEGDYTLRFQFAPNVPGPVIQQALYNSIGHVFLEKKANRILVPVHKSNKTLLDWVKEAHFKLATGLPQKTQYPLYMRTR
jgi:hypothetical protein